MADLEEMGFLLQPHTSAGRVPTDLGYRYYVDLLRAEGMTSYSDIEILQELYRKLERLRNDMDMLLNEATRSLSMLSHYLGIAMSPMPDLTTLKRINLLKYRADAIAAVMLTDEGIKNKVISVDSEISQKDLNRITALLNAEFSGYTFDEIRMKIVRDMSYEKIACDTLISRAMKICQEALSLPLSGLFVSGLAEVLELPDFADLRKIRELSKAIQHRHAHGRGSHSEIWCSEKLSGLLRDLDLL